MKRIPWNKGRKGLQIAWNKGLTKEDPRVKKYSEKLKISKSGIKLSDEHKEKIKNSLLGRVPWNVGIPTSNLVKDKIRSKLIGNKNPFYGKKHTALTKSKISKSRTGKCLGASNPKALNFNIEDFKQDLIESYRNGFSSNYLASKYKISSTTLINYLKKWKVEIRISAYGYRGKILCKDNHKVMSAYEVEIDNFLYENGINHETNGLIIKSKQYKYDFYIRDLDLYIEYWGLVRSNKYNLRKKKKLEIYSELNAKVLSLYPKDKFPDKLRWLIPLCSKKQKTILNFQ